MGSSLVIGILVSISGLEEASSMLGCYDMSIFNRLQYNTLVSGKLGWGGRGSCECSNELSASMKCGYFFLTN